jgi:hypothetical protein
LHCSCVTDLRLHSAPPDFDASHLADILQTMPLLEELAIQIAPPLTSLAPFAEAGPHQSRLTRLSLERVSVDCSMPPTEVKHLYSLSALTYLALFQVCRLPNEVREELRPNLPSDENRRVQCAIPALTSSYSWP